MNDHNLDDLIIDTIAPKNNKTKSLLTIVALLIIILIVAIVLTKTLLKTPESDELSFEENMSEMIAPELQLQAQEEVKVTEVSKPKEEASLSEIIEEKTTVLEDMKEEAEKPVPEDMKKEIEESTIVNETTKPLETKKEEAPVQTPIIKEVSEKPITKPVVKTTKQPTVTKLPVKKETKKPDNSSKIPKSNSTGRYYVQVSSFRSPAPSNRLLTIIKNSGFSSHVSAPDSTGYKKLLIGPYRTRADVDKVRDIVRDRILKSAFVVER